MHAHRFADAPFVIGKDGNPGSDEAGDHVDVCVVNPPHRPVSMDPDGGSMEAEAVGHVDRSRLHRSLTGEVHGHLIVGREHDWLAEAGSGIAAAGGIGVAGRTCAASMHACA